MAINNVMLLGRLTRDPELRHTQSGTSVASFTLAVDGFNKGDVDFINCVAWRQTGEFVSKYFEKGDQLALTGRISVRNYEDKNGDKRTATEVIAERVSFCGGKKSEGKIRRGEDVTAEDFEDLDEDEELPF